MFRFEGLEIWNRSIRLTDQLFDVADHIHEKHHFRLAYQLRGSALSISNNIAEGSGSSSRKDFQVFLNYAHRSIFESVNMIMIAHRRKFISQTQLVEIKDELEVISKMVSAFSKTLLTRKNF